MSMPASRRQSTTSFEVTKPSQPTKRKNICPVLPPSRLPRLVMRLSRPISSEEGHVARNLPKLVLPGDLLHEGRVLAHRIDLGAVADDRGVGEQIVPVIV